MSSRPLFHALLGHGGGKYVNKTQTLGPSNSTDRLVQKDA
jgi:hypothetical protein